MKNLILRRRVPIKLLLATGNSHKVEEFKRILEPLGIEIMTPEQLHVVSEAEETGTTFAENARIKAMELYQKTGVPCVADDSGLVIDAMNGEPGVYSARFCGESTSYPDRFSIIFQRLQDVPLSQRTASFVCHICCVLDRDTILDCEGVVHGTIGFQAKGEMGFGYDPIFYVGDISMGEMTQSQKDSLSHRGKALEILFHQLEQTQTNSKEIV